MADFISHPGTILAALSAAVGFLIWFAKFTQRVDDDFDKGIVILTGSDL